MNTLTHLGISQIVQKSIEDEFSIRLNKVGFMFGNIKPDISSSLVKIPHFKDDSFDFIKEEIRELMNMRIESLDKCSRHFSEKLGIVTHYISDYFCYAHSNQFRGNVFDHYLYESKLSQYYKLNSNLIKSLQFKKVIEVITDHHVLIEYIDEIHDKYTKSINSYESDILYTLKICISISLSIVLSCIQHKTGTAA